MLLHVVDAAAPGAPDRVDAVQRILDELKLEPPRLVVLNKADLADPVHLEGLAERYDAVAVSAVTGDGLDELKADLTLQLESGAPLATPAEEAASGRASARRAAESLDSMEA